MSHPGAWERVPGCAATPAVSVRRSSQDGRAPRIPSLSPVEERMMPATTLKIEHARFALTLDAERRIIQDASILVEGQRITRVGKAAELADVSADRVIDGRRFVVTPGLFNGHMHISYAHAVRGIFPDDLANRLFHVFN